MRLREDVQEPRTAGYTSYRLDRTPRSRSPHSIAAKEVHGRGHARFEADKGPFASRYRCCVSESPVLSASHDMIRRSAKATSRARTISLRDACEHLPEESPHDLVEIGPAIALHRQ